MAKKNDDKDSQYCRKSTTLYYQGHKNVYVMRYIKEGISRFESDSLGDRFTFHDQQ